MRGRGQKHFLNIYQASENDSLNILWDIENFKFSDLKKKGIFYQKKKSFSEKLICNMKNIPVWGFSQ